MTHRDWEEGRELIKKIRELTEAELQRWIAFVDQNEQRRAGERRIPFLFKFVTMDGQRVDWAAFVDAVLTLWRHEFEDDIANIYDWSWDGVTRMDDFNTDHIIKIIRQWHWVTYYVHGLHHPTDPTSYLISNPHMDMINQKRRLAQDLTNSYQPLPSPENIEEARQRWSSESQPIWAVSDFISSEAHSVASLFIGEYATIIRRDYRDGLAIEKALSLTEQALTDRGRDKIREKKILVRNLRIGIAELIETRRKNADAETLQDALIALGLTFLQNKNPN